MWKDGRGDIQSIGNEKSSKQLLPNYRPHWKTSLDYKTDSPINILG